MDSLGSVGLTEEDLATRAGRTVQRLREPIAKEGA